MIEVLNELAKNDPLNMKGKFLVTADNKQALSDIKHYIARKPGKLDPDKGILFLGNPGTGKTMMIECLKICLLRVWGKVLTVMTAPYIKLNYYEKDWDKVSVPHQVFNYRYLAINDIGMERDYVSGENIIQNILFDRYEKRMLTFGTTNLSIDEFFSRYMDDKGRMKDRYQTMFNYVVLNGKSFR